MIYLCGFMGSGKTTLWEKLKSERGLEGFDFDCEIAKRNGVSPTALGEYIESIGFPEFRKQEEELLIETINGPQDAIYALGGGTLFYGDCLNILRGSDKAQVFWVNTNVEECWNRVREDKNRPLVKKGREEFVKLYEKRLKTYQLFETVTSHLLMEKQQD